MQDQKPEPSQVQKEEPRKMNRKERRTSAAITRNAIRKAKKGNRK